MKTSTTVDRPLRVALSKGRIFDETLPLFEAAGVRPSEDPSTSRRLILPSATPAEGEACAPLAIGAAERGVRSTS